MFFPFTNFKKIDVPTINNGGTVIHTTTADSLVWFMPIGGRMEDDTAAFVYVPGYFVDTDGGSASLFIYWSLANRSTLLQLNHPSGGGGENSTVQGYGSCQASFVPAGKNILAGVNDSSDRIGGTLYVLELP